MPLSGQRIAVVVDGAPDAYESAERVRALRRAGAEVRVAMTEEALRWVGAATFEAVAGAPLLRDEGLPGDGADFDALLVAPAGRDLIARLAVGRAADPATALFLGHGGRRVLVPSREAPPVGLTRVHLSALADAVTVLEPETGAEALVAALAPSSEEAEAAAARWRSLEGRRILVTAGPTREHLDPVRFLSNPSSGKMGYALAAVAAERGAEVVLVSGPTHLSVPPGVRRVSVTSAAEMAKAVWAEVGEGAPEGRAGAIDVFIGAAAVADYTPVEVAPRKIKKGAGELVVRLKRTEDILGRLAERSAGRPGRPLLVGFAAETEELERRAREKRAKKGVDLVVGNLVGGTGGAFGADENEVILVDREGIRRLGRRPKREVARPRRIEVQSAYLAANHTRRDPRSPG